MKIEIPEQMKQWTLWALWILLISGASIWLLVGTVAYWVKHGWLPPDTSGWAQFGGAILALIAAIFAPIWHSSVVTRRKHRDSLELIAVLSDSTIEALWLLSHSFINVDTEVSNMRAYLRSRREHEWESLAQSVNQVSMSEIPPNSARILQALKDAVSFGGYIARQMQDWVDSKSSRPDEVVTLRAKRDFLTLMRSRLPGETPYSHAQEAGIQFEGKRPILNPFTHHDVRIFRRYSWSPMNRIAPIKVQVQLVFPYGSGHPTTFDLTIEEFGWQSIEHAEGFVWGQAIEIIDRELSYG